jgi:hypothetical protein
VNSNNDKPTPRQVGRWLLWHLEGLYLKVAIEILFRGTLKRYRKELKVAVIQGVSEAELVRIFIASETGELSEPRGEGTAGGGGKP